MLATVRANRARIGRQSRSARPVRSRKTSSSVARRIARFWGSSAARVGERRAARRSSARRRACRAGPRRRRSLTDVTAGRAASSVVGQARRVGSKRTARSWKRFGHELVDRAHLEDPAVVHDREPVAQDLGLFHVVGRQQHRAPVGLEPADEVPQRPPGRRVEAGRRLVEEDELRVVDERQRDRQALALAARQVLAAGVAPLAELERVDELVRRPGVLVEAAEEVDELGDGQLRVERRRLEADPDPRLERVGAAWRRRCRARDLAAVGRAQPLEDLDGRGLARAVRVRAARRPRPRRPRSRSRRPPGCRRSAWSVPRTRMTGPGRDGRGAMRAVRRRPVRASSAGTPRPTRRSRATRTGGGPPDGGGRR